ncbi:major capsid protein [Petrimonas sulfuriphila]|uniref:major capsid protein n=1 Tax=Petrimonas sulfuriphila TaxID=285070 RepID=UPI003EBB23CC
MVQRNKEFYDLIGKGLASLGYSGADALNLYIQDMFAEKYNSDAIYSQMGFPLNPNIPISPTYEQIEAAVRVYTMATYVDIDSDGATKSTEGATLKQGGLPTFKHEVPLSRKIMREQMMLADRIGGADGAMEEVAMTLLFNGLDDLLGGNYNTMRYQRNQIISNEGKLVVNANNNPLGVALTVDFGVPSKNIFTDKWYAVNSSTGVVTEQASIDPIKKMKDVKKSAENKDYAPKGHWEVSKNTWDIIVDLPYFRKQYAQAIRPEITDATAQLAYGNTIEDDVIKAYIEKRVGAPIVIVDALSAVDKKGKAEYITSFNDGVLVYVPDGDLGDAQFGRPIYLQSSASRAALYDGGRTLIRQIFNDETMTSVVKSEVTGLIVPNKTRWFYYLHVD